jgi:hypothetical protein
MSESRITIPATRDELREQMRVPTWIHLAGFGFEKLHTNLIVHCLSSTGREALAAALWSRATGQTVSAAEVQACEVRREVKLGTGQQNVLDGWLRLQIAGTWHTLGLEVKVDSSPVGKQLEAFVTALQAKAQHQKGEARLALLALGGAQIFHSPSHIPKSVLRWTGADLLALQNELLGANQNPNVVREWLCEIAHEQARRVLAMSISHEEADALGYRGRGLGAYQYGALSQTLATKLGAPWLVTMQGNNACLTGARSWYTRRAPGLPEVRLSLEHSQGALCLKATCPQKSAKPHHEARSIVQAMRQALAAEQIATENPRQVQGEYVTTLQIPVSATAPNAAEMIGRVSALWSQVAQAQGLVYTPVL